MLDSEVEVKKGSGRLDRPEAGTLRIEMRRKQTAARPGGNMLECVAFLCGAAVMVLEMAGARLLAPYLGTSVIVWTALIGVILASLSVGYWLGGKMADRGPKTAFLGRLISAAALTVLLVAFVSSALLEALSALGVSLYASAVLAALFLFCPSGVLLGMVSPYTMRLHIALKEISAERSGAVIGRFSALSTIGSILGTFLGGYVLISILGTRYILFSVAGTLLVAALIVLALPEPSGARKSKKSATPRKKRGAALVIALGFAACGAGAILAQRSEAAALAAGIREVDTRYNHVVIFDRPWKGHPHRFLVTDPGKHQSSVRLDAPDELAGSYGAFFALTDMYKPLPQRVLMLGGGGVVVPRRLLFEADKQPERPPLAIDVVEIDPGMTDVARRYFFLRDDPRLRMIHEDGRTFLNKKDNALYDVVLLDTFNSHYAIPFHLCTVEAMRAIHRRLADDGVVAMNIIGSLGGEHGRLFRAIRASAARVFPEVRVFTVSSGSPDAVQNLMLVAAKGPAAGAWHPLLAHEYTAVLPDDVPPLTDDFAPVERYAIYD